ncbi:MAG: ATP-binding cassette domain-containing protein, partial [Magnetococcus sp. DMHC-8]
MFDPIARFIRRHLPSHPDGASAASSRRAWFSLDGSRLGSTVLLLALLSLMVNVIGLAVPLALLQVYNRIIPNQGETTLFILVIGVLGALLMEAVLRWFRAYYTGWIGARFEHVTGCDIFNRMLHANPNDVAREAGADMLERMEDIQTVGELYSGQLLLALFDVPFLLLYVTLLWQLGGELAMVPVCSIVLVIAASYRLGIQMGKALDADRKSAMRRFGFVTETLGRVHSVKSMAMESLMLRRYELLQNAHAQKTREIIFRGVVLPTFSSFMAQANTALVVTFGAIAVMDGELTTGGLAACTMLSGRMFQPLQTLVGGWTRLQTIRIARHDLDSLLKLPKPPPRPAFTTRLITQFTGQSPTVDQTAVAVESPPEEQGFRLELVQVSIDFTGNKPVLDNVSMTLRQGETIAIIGDSGSGKSTLLQLLAGRVQPTAGVMRFNDEVVREVPWELIKSTAYVPQKGTLFNGSILQNITMFDDALDDVGLQVAAMLGLDRAVARMPKGYNTIIGDGAAESLPAGVVQRIAIARSLAMLPRVILFDESNMAIDSAGDIMLRDCLEQMKKQYGCTIVLVSWRPSLLRLADRSFRLIDGHLQPLKSYQEAFAPLPAVVDAQAAKPGPAADGPSSASREVVPLELPEPPPWQEFVDRLPRRNHFTRCLKGLLEALHWQGPARQVAEALPHLLGAMDVTDFCNSMANLRYTHRSERVVLGKVDIRQAPFLLVGKDQDEVMVVLGHDDEGAIVVLDGRQRGKG